MKIVSLFAGCGGLDLGFEQAGFDVIWANEYDETIHETYRLNHPKTILDTRDIRTLKGGDIPDCDGIIGGPPCQAWSEGGKQLGIKDPRGQLFLDFIRIVREKKPKFFLIENVQGILHEKHSESLKLFLNSLKDAGYRIFHELLNASDYRIPQDRFRVFFIGIRNDLNKKYVFPDATTTVPITLRQAIGDIVEVPSFFGNTKITVGNKFRKNHDVYVGSFDAKYMSRNRVRGWNEMSFTIQAQARNAPLHPQAPKMTHVNSNLYQFVRGYEHLYRRLSVRECARIQTFPDSFCFIYDRVENGYKMVGNAVPPRLAWNLAQQMKRTFAEEFDISNGNNNISVVGIKSILKRLDISEIKEKYLQNIIVNNDNVDNLTELADSKRVLIGFVKPDNIDPYMRQEAKIYYTGKHFPSGIELDSLYYFMPYIKGKGVKDLYVIRIVRVGSKHEVHPSCGTEDFRLIFEIEFVKELYPDYKPIHLNIWHTFSYTTLGELLKINEEED